MSNSSKVVKRKKYPLNIKDLPPGVKEAWFYGGINSSIHIIMHPIEEVVQLTDNTKITHTIKIPQINIDFRSIT